MLTDSATGFARDDYTASRAGQGEQQKKGHDVDASAAKRSPGSRSRLVGGIGGWFEWQIHQRANRNGWLREEMIVRSQLVT